MKNRLAEENSPYLLQHARNPVFWYPWGPEALLKAKTENKPIFLSIGYAACHWCHVMAHESFEDPDTAALMNEHFINIKVDREERPDLDSIYMSAVVSMTGQGGWPMSVFLTPDLKPFYGGTYFPPERRYNMPSFREVLQAIARLWKEDRSRLLESGEQLTDHLSHNPTPKQQITSFTDKSLNQASAALAQNYDWKNGGWGKAPKFPQPMTVEFLLRKAARGDSFARDIAMHALLAMAKGGMYDVVGGGFARYSTDDYWRTPHFEKMLYDNAQLALAYLHGWLVSGAVQFRTVCEETLDFVLREMLHVQGGFYSSLDADSEGEEGKYYIWSLDELQSTLDEEGTTLAIAAYNITHTGNFEGKNILQRALTDEQLAEKFSLNVDDIRIRIRSIHEKLDAVRSKRIRPGTDDKILTAWNSLMLIAFSEAGRYLKRKDYLSAAQRNADFLLNNLMDENHLYRSWRNNRAQHQAYLEDYSALILGLLSLYQSDGNLHWYKTAVRLANDMVSHFKDPEGGFFDTRDDHETLLYRPKELQDNATPSGNALAACALLQLAAFEGRSDWRRLVERMLNEVHETAVRYPTAFAQWLQALDFFIGPVYELAILGDPENQATSGLFSMVWERFQPRLVASLSTYPPLPGAPALFENRTLLNNQATAYVCQGFICKAPTNLPHELSELLEKGIKSP